MGWLWIAVATYALLSSCAVKGSSQPVELVKAADIKVIAALGDSLTTAIGANASNVLGIPIEFRHVSFSIGGYGSLRDVITLANIIKLFNPSVLGAAPSPTVHGTTAPLGETGFNLAVTGHNTFNLPGQTRHLIDTLRSYQGLKFEEDWKLLTILIGMNDICDYCKDKALFSVDNFIHYMTVSLEMLMNEVPRMIVNVVQIVPMETLREVQRPAPGCLLQRSFCSCLIKPVGSSPELRELVEVNLEFQKRLEQLLYSSRFFRDDFAVNGKFQPEGQKLMVSSFSDPIDLICPPLDHPYIFTRPAAAKRGGLPPVLDDPASGCPSWATHRLFLLVLLACMALWTL
ncbi:hypothetical protein NHX12_026248 [Muraenolepis orangiensis]|uniref:Phospholipase B1, membrane-associated n=1 Tax=Muraenolepis orangiensis TaxID=630683 RepID=A0A9Q0IQ35_9TELE|nr:hypothetical protein NHX12_026248 [Muraenolepis orangiensis]